MLCGYLTSAGYGYTVNKPIGLGYVKHNQGVDDDYLLSGSYELEVASEIIPCEIHLKPLYDPQSARVKA